MTKRKVTFQLKKLVRDRYYDDMISDSSRRVNSRVLDGKELRHALFAKIREELDELESGDDEKPTDVGSAIIALVRLYGLLPEDFLAEIHVKDANLGSFRGGHFVQSLTFDEDNKWVEYYRKDPVKYPESSSIEAVRTGKNRGEV